MKNNLLKYLVIAALLVNAATLLFFWLKRPPHGDRPPRQPFEVLTQELQLNGDQQAIFKTLREQHHQSHDSLLQLMAEKRKVLYTEKPASIDSAAQQIGQLQQEIEKLTYHHFEEVRKICTPEQQAKLGKILVGAVQNVLMPKMSNKPGPPQPPPPPKKD